MPETSNPTPQRGDSSRNIYGQLIASPEEVAGLQQEVDAALVKRMQTTIHEGSNYSEKDVAESIRRFKNLK